MSIKLKTYDTIYTPKTGLPRPCFPTSDSVRQAGDRSKDITPQSKPPLTPGEGGQSEPEKEAEVHQMSIDDQKQPIVGLVTALL